MKNYKIASVLMIVHGGVMELGTFVALSLLWILGGDLSFEGRESFIFIVPFLQENLLLMMMLSGIFGTTRLVGAIALWKNRLWGLVLSVINCVVTMQLMIFMLPAGIVDGILACSALILMLSRYFGKRKIEE